jgi:polyisoprenoid-binding protein YceI
MAAGFYGLHAQKYITKNGHIKFFSSAPLEDIEANNHQVNSALDIKTGDFVFKVLMKAFEFEKALMQEHFNENYVESHKFPNASFVGKVINLNDIDFTKDGTHKAIVEGDLTIHGITKQVKEEGIFTVKDEQISGKAIFKVKVADYEIKIPKNLAKNIAEVVEVTVDVKLDKYK